MTSLVTNIQGYSIHDGPGIRTVVFFKGCGLQCQWCSNPECISPRPEAGFIKNLCTKCGACASVCPEGALAYAEGNFPRIDRGKCTGCGACSAACSYKALVLYGHPMSAGEIYDAVSRDKMFYDASGGGITVSGGEALLQAQMVQELFMKCREASIHTCIETSGQAPETAWQQVLPYTDLVLFDLKLMDAEKHRQYTGQTNGLIQANARTAAKSGVHILCRMPLIPGINDDRQNILATAAFVKGLVNKDPRIELMPYHRLGQGKYLSLDKPYALPQLKAPEPAALAEVKKIFDDNGVVCTISR